MRKLSRRMQGDQQRKDRDSEAPAPGRVTRVERVLRKADRNGVDTGADAALARAASSSGAPLPAAVSARASLADLDKAKLAYQIALQNAVESMAKWQQRLTSLKPLL